MRYILPLVFLLTGCDTVFSAKNSETTIVRATCSMDGFDGFPKKVTGPVTLDLKNFLTILVKSDDGSEQVEITFPKSKCGAN